MRSKTFVVYICIIMPETNKDLLLTIISAPLHPLGLGAVESSPPRPSLPLPSPFYFPFPHTPSVLTDKQISTPVIIISCRRDYSYECNNICIISHAVKHCRQKAAVCCNHVVSSLQSRVSYHTWVSWAAWEHQRKGPGSRRRHSSLGQLQSAYI